MAESARDGACREERAEEGLGRFVSPGLGFNMV